MASYTASVTGDWGNSATWGGSGVPGDGDITTINNGITVTVSDARIVGTGVAASTAITISATGYLKITTGGILTLKGNISSSGEVILDGSGILEFDTTNQYNLNFTGGTAATLKLYTTNTSTTVRASIRSTTADSTKYGYITFASFRGFVSLSHCDIIRMGTSTTAWITSNLNSGSPLLTFFTQDCNLIQCGLTTVANFSTDANLTIDSCSWSGTTSSYCLSSGPSVDRVSGIRLINNCTFDQSMSNAVTTRGFTITGNLMKVGWGATASTPWDKFSGNLIRGTGVNNGAVTINNWAGVSLNPENNIWNYIHLHNDYDAQIINPHPISFSASLNTVVGGIILDPGNTDTNGDLITLSAPSTPKTCKIKYILALPIGSGTNFGKHFGTLVSAGGGANLTASIEHCTCYSDTALTAEVGGVRVSETYDGYSGMLSGIKSILAWSQNSGSAMIYCRNNRSTAAADICLASNCNYNATWNGSFSGSYGGLNPGGKAGYYDYIPPPAISSMFIDTTGLGLNDVTVSANPFVDVDMANGYWRNIASWAVYKGLPKAVIDGGGVLSSTGTYKEKVNAAYQFISSSPSSNIYDLVSWVKYGWAVKDPSLNNAGHDGITIGSLGYIQQQVYNGIIRKYINNNFGFKIIEFNGNFE